MEPYLSKNIDRKLVFFWNSYQDLRGILHRVRDRTASILGGSIALLGFVSPFRDPSIALRPDNCRQVLVLCSLALLAGALIVAFLIWKPSESLLPGQYEDLKRIWDHDIAEPEEVAAINMMQDLSEPIRVKLALAERVNALFIWFITLDFLSVGLMIISRFIT
jgi:hypothetical protein